jgi:rare lipoprotein A
VSPRALAAVALVLVLTGCGGRQATRGERAEAPARGSSSVDGAAPFSCVAAREHDETRYEPGGLYDRHTADSAPAQPPDVSGLPEPVPRREPRSAHGNRSPYTVLGRSYRVLDEAEGYVERGVASWYGYKFHGRPTSSREPYDLCAFSAAHRSLPLPSYVRVTNLDNGRSVVVRVNDRGPFHDGRLIDLSYAAAARLDMLGAGTARVEVRALEGPDGGATVPRLPQPPATAALPDRGFVQVGSYAERDNARAVAERLEEAGFDEVEIEDARVDQGRVWRVRVGPARGDALRRLLDAVRAAGFPSARVFGD